MLDGFWDNATDIPDWANGLPSTLADRKVEPPSDLIQALHELAYVNNVEDTLSD